jgi:hypothetical protein
MLNNEKILDWSDEATETAVTNDRPLPTRQQVKCLVCKWQGDSPVKKILRVAGRDYPLICRHCEASALYPLDAEI